MSQTPIPMTTATGMGPLPELLERFAGAKAVERSFERENLPLALIEDPENRIPLASLVRLFEHAGREVGDRLFGLRVGLGMAPGAYGLWTEYAAGGRTLQDALIRLARTIAVHQIGSRIGLTSCGENAVWSYCPPDSVATLGRLHSDHVLPVMIGFVRLFLGSDWRPEWVEVNYSDDGYERDLSDALQSSWRFGRTGVRLAFPKNLLLTPRPSGPQQATRILSSVDLAAEFARKRAESQLDAVEAIVALRLLEGHADIDGVAYLAGTSVRSLHRRLDRNGQSFRRILDRVRHRKAKALLVETSLPITEIAFSLGFNEAASFTRAFRRWMGVPPNALRTE
jgi:AraC-like DNA-binding protein